MIIRVGPTKGVDTDKLPNALYKAALTQGLIALYEQDLLSQEYQVPLKQRKSFKRK